MRIAICDDEEQYRAQLMACLTKLGGALDTDVESFYDGNELLREYEKEPFDIAFLDPPYKSGVLFDALDKTVKIMSDYGIVFCEHPTDMRMPDSAGGFNINRTYKFGSIAVTTYKKEVKQ